MPSSETRLSPKDRRLVLAQLPRARLAELVEQFELAVTDRRSVDAHIDAIVRKRTLDFRQVLECLRREELQGACEALGLDAGGREKAKLVDRILGRGDAAGASPSNGGVAPPAPTTSSSAPPPASARSEGTLKSALRRFVLDLAGGIRGRDAATSFIARLLQCRWSGASHAYLRG